MSSVAKRTSCLISEESEEIWRFENAGGATLVPTPSPLSATTVTMSSCSTSTFLIFVGDGAKVHGFNSSMISFTRYAIGTV